MDNNNNRSAARGDDKFVMASERDHFPPPSYDYGMEMTESPVSIHAAPVAALPPQLAERHVMRDDERYPTVVETQPGLCPYEPEQDVASAASATASVSPLSPTTRNFASLTAVDQGAQTLEAKEMSDMEPARKILGLPRRRFFMVATAVGVTLLCAMIISVAIGVTTTRSREAKRYPAITASGLYIDANNTEWHMHLVHTNLTSGALTVKSNNGTGSWTSEQDVNLTIVPEMDAPISATSVLGHDGRVYLNLFYIKEGDIVLANITCVEAACTTISNAVISKEMTFPLLENSALDSVYLNSSMGYRVFYHNSDRYVTQLASPGDGTWDHGSTISGKALKGSSISASVLGDGGAINVIYVDDHTQSLYNVQFDDGRWRNPTSIITASPLPNWTPLTSISSSYQPATDILSAFFTGADKLVYQLAATNASTSEFAQIVRGDAPASPTTAGISTAGWNQTAYRDLAWAPSDAPGAEIASVGWAAQTRFFRLIDGDLAESLQMGGVWSANYI
ncbi:hypothetical protein LZ554_004956 [Drepanopeziza brunnea f. sp. 'monogermtubi']|nr:hypothetical protein LZ554_004956 [Drepanopeziza brunnea f. sp. 'monogermtubi']